MIPILEQLVPVIVGGLIGISGSLVNSVWTEHSRRKSEIRSIKGAILGEIDALIKIVEQRRYIAGIQELLAQAKATDKPSLPFHFSVRRNPFAVYDAILPKLGMLSHPLPQQITQFYTMASSILEDITDMREGNFIARNRNESIHRLEELLALFESTQTLGKQIIETLSSEKP